MPSPWSARHWALPVLTVPTRSPALSRKRRTRHRPAPEYAEILIGLIRRWQPEREVVLVGDSAFGDSAFATAGLGLTCQPRAHLPAPRWAARLAAAAQRPTRRPGPTAAHGHAGRQAGRHAQEGAAATAAEAAARPRRPCADRLGRDGDRLVRRPAARHGPGNGHRALARRSGTAMGRRHCHGAGCSCATRLGNGSPSPSSAPTKTPACCQIMAWYVSRWAAAVTFAEVRAHLGFQTQRHVEPTRRRPHHAVPARALQPDHPARRSGGLRSAANPTSRLVGQGGADLRRRARGRPSPVLGRGECANPSRRGDHGQCTLLIRDPAR